MAYSFSGKRPFAAHVAFSVLAFALPAGASSLLPTTTSLVSSPAAAPYYAGQAITYVATVAAASGTPSGTVIFTVDGVTAAPVQVNSSLTASLVLHPLAGTHSIFAAYGGDANYQSSTSSVLTQSISKAATSIDMASNPPQIAQPVAIRAAVTVKSPGGAVPGGTVDFALGTNPIAACTGIPVQNGVAICNTTFVQTGTLTIGTIYNGDANTSPSGGSLQVTVAKCTPGVYLAADNIAPANGGPVTLGVLVLGANGVPSPTGTVTLSDGPPALATLPLGPDGKASLVVPSGTLAPFSAGTHIINAVYNGDSYYLQGTASSVTVVMTGKAASTITVTSTPAQIAQTVKLTATVAVSGTSAASPTGTVDFTNGTAAISGCTGVAVQSGTAVCSTNFAQAGTITINVGYSGDANTSSSKGSMQLTVAKGTASVSLTASSTAAPAGATVTLTALVSSAPGAPTPTGTVTFSDGTTTLGSVPVSSDGHATLAIPSTSVPAFATGNHSIGAAYSGDTNYSPSSAPNLTVTVSKPVTVVNLTATPAQLAQPVKITASLSTPAAGGTVDFTNSSTPIAGCLGLPVQNGAAVCNTTFIQVGTVTINASYSGDTNLTPGTGSLQLTVTKCNPGAYLAASPTAPAYGTAVTLGMLVLGSAGVPNPTGTVTFSDGVNSLGTVSLGTDGHAILAVPSGSIAPFNAGTHNLTAVYAGDANYASATAPVLALAVGKAATTLSIAASPSAPAVSQNTTFSAAISPAASGAVSFNNGPNAIAGCTSIPVQSGTATCTASFPLAGSFTITAVYSGDMNAGPATGTLQLTVGQTAKPASLISLNAIPNAPYFGTAVTITASALASAGGTTPSGSVTFSDGTSVLGTGALNSSGQASLTVPSATSVPISVGTHSIGAAYGGDSNYSPGAAPPVTITVLKAPTTTVLTTPASGPFTATVSVPGFGTPTGQVQFLNGTAILGTTPLLPQGNNFIATFPRTGQTGSVTAAYLGDSNFASSLSPAIPVTAAKAQITVASNLNPSTSGQAVTFTVYASSDSGGTPTGSVQLLADGNSLTTVTLAAGVAMFRTSSLGIGNHNIVANYAGDGNYPPASASLSQTVSGASASLSVIATPAVSVFGQPVTLTAQWTAPAGATAPSTPVLFSDGTSTLGTASLSTGAATLTLSNLAAGSHSITAACAGDTTWGAVISSPVSQTVSKAQTTTVLTTGAGAATITATVAALDRKSV